MVGQVTMTVQQSLFGQLKMLLVAGLAAETLTSLILWMFAPMDTVREWYPWFVVYVGEFLGVWVVVVTVSLAVGAIVLRHRPILAGYPYLRLLAAGVVLVGLDLATALSLWPWRPTLWPGNLERMLTARLQAFAVALALAALTFWTVGGIYKLLRPRPEKIPV